MGILNEKSLTMKFTKEILLLAVATLFTPGTASSVNWKCGDCTFENDLSISKCSICEKQRPENPAMVYYDAKLPVSVAPKVSDAEEDFPIYGEPSPEPAQPDYMDPARLDSNKSRLGAIGGFFRRAGNDIGGL